MIAATRQRALYVLLGLAVIWGVYNLGSPRKSTSKPESAPAVAAVAPQSVRTSPPADIAAWESKPWGRDPFRTQSRRGSYSTAPTARPQSASWNLSGIVYNEEDPLAIVNNRPVRIGDQINGATVVDINKREVTLETGGGRVTLRVASKG